MLHNFYVFAEGFLAISYQCLPILSVVILEPLIVMDSLRWVFRRLEIQHDSLGVFQC